MLTEADRIKAPLLLHIAEEDKYTPPDVREKIIAGLATNPKATVQVYPGVDHAFARTGGVHYDPEAARLADERTAALFKKVLG